MEKRYRLGKSEVAGLGKLYVSGGEALKREDIGLTNSEYAVFAKLGWFGLARREEGLRWSITDLGIAFVEGRARVQSVAVTQNREFVGLEGEFVKAGDLNQDFQYETAGV